MLDLILYFITTPQFTKMAVHSALLKAGVRTTTTIKPYEAIMEERSCCCRVEVVGSKALMCMSMLMITLALMLPMPSLVNDECVCNCKMYGVVAFTIFQLSSLCLIQCSSNRLDRKNILSHKPQLCRGSRHSASQRTVCARRERILCIGGCA